MFLRYRSLLTLLLIGFSGLLVAQPQLYSTKQRAKLFDLGQTFSGKFTENYDRAYTKALAMGRPIQFADSDGRVVWLRGISDTGELIYYSTHSTTRAGISTKTNSLYAGGVLGLSLTGGSSIMQNRLGEWDGAAVRPTHVELTGRVTQGDDGSLGLNGTLAESQLHATHVGGILMATGKNPLVRGMAYKAGNLQAYNATNDNAEMTAAAAKGLLISNHSYGPINGWYFNSSLTGAIEWQWLGDTTLSQTDDYHFGLYDSGANSWDVIANNAPNYLIVHSAGNDHGPTGPTPGTAYYLGNYGTGQNITSTKTRSDQSSFGQLSGTANSKNVLVVGAVSNLNNGYNQPSDVKIASFSSWGPTDDGRIKPDIVGVGVNVLSTVAANDSAYQLLSGTSMSSPQVAGSLFLLQELYGQRNGGKFMRAATLRGLALHTTSEAGTTPGPDYTFGWGLLNTEAAARVLLNDASNHLLTEQTLATGGTYSVTVVASGRGPLQGTICWNDPAGVAQGKVFNVRTPRLINDLDLRIVSGSTTTLPWTLDPNNPGNAAVRADNVVDNIEQVRIDNPVPGQTYVLNVSAKNSLGSSGQEYALIVSGIGGTAYCTSGATSSADTKISQVQFGSLNQAGATGCTTYTSFLTQTPTTIQAGQTIPLSVGVGTCGAAQTAIVKAFVDWNANGTFTDASDLIATSGPTATGSTFTTNVTIPTSVTAGQFARLRIVVGQTSDPNAVAACGSYAGGETQDYVLQVAAASNDVSPNALLSPTGNFCALTNTQPVTVQVQNIGSAAQTNVPVTLQVYDATNNLLKTLTSTVASLSAYNTASVTFGAETLPAFAAGQTYKFVTTTNLVSDQNPANNVFSTTIATAATSVGQFSASGCGTAVTLRNTGAGTAYWYDGTGNLLAVGNQTSLTSTPSGGIQANVDDFKATFGPVSKYVFTGGTYSGNFGPEPLISTTVPLTIQSARLYIAAAGQLTFGIARLDGTPTNSSVTLNVTPTRNTSLTATTNSQLNDDPNDQGQVYQLNLSIPVPGDYKITIGYANGASLFRSNAGVSIFPIQLKAQNGSPIITSAGSLYDPGTGSTTLTAAYYYLYNMQITSANCPGISRTAVPVSAGTAGGTTTITATGATTICSSGGSVVLNATSTGSGNGFQWLLNGSVIAGATGPAYTATTTGTYTAQALNGCAGPTSNAIAVSLKSAVTPTISILGQTLTSSSLTGNQWLLNGVVISGATGQTYTALQTGNYSVQVNTGCGTATSASTYVAITATEEEVAALFRVYPNPTQRVATVEIAATTLANVTPTVKLIDTAGRTVLTSGMQRDGKIYTTTFSLSQLSGGTFVVVVDDNQGHISRRTLVKW